MASVALNHNHTTRTRQDVAERRREYGARIERMQKVLEEIAVIEDAE